MESRSLFILSLPRSLSSNIQRSVTQTGFLKNPFWTSSGEILNLDRLKSVVARKKNEKSHYLTISSGADRYQELLNYLDESVFERGYVFKDVVQPFVITQWLSKNPYPVIKIQRNFNEIVYRMIKQQWFYPVNASDGSEKNLHNMVVGLRRGWKAIQSVPGITLNYADLVESEEPLRIALSELYPDFDFSELSYVNSKFKEESKKQQAILTDKEFYRLEEMIAGLGNVHY